MGVDLQKYMFEVLAGDYGSPPADSDYGLGGINIAPDPSLKLEIFNNKMNTFGRIDDIIDPSKHITKIEKISEENIGKNKWMETFLAVGGVAEYGPAGGLLGNVVKNKKEILFMVQTKVGNTFIAKADEKTYEKIFKQSGYDPSKELAEKAWESLSSNSSSVEKAFDNDIIGELEKLASLKERGMLSDEEFSSLKSDLMTKRQSQPVKPEKDKTAISLDTSWEKKDNSSWKPYSVDRWGEPIEENENKPDNDVLDPNSQAGKIAQSIISALFIIFLIFIFI